MRRVLRNTIAIAIATIALTSTSRAMEPKEFLARHCIMCHGAEKQEADLRLDRLQTQADKELTQRWHEVYAMVAEHQMPPDEVPQPSDHDRTRFLSWIERTYGSPERSTDHWSLKPMVRGTVPSTDRESMSPIDAFVHRRLAEAGLNSSPVADRRTLVRRVYLDLIGIPPTPEDVLSFIQDPAPRQQAFTRVVEHLLNSKRYGERWAQHWLDVIRWAETVGFETNLERPNAWHYRDWVIRALNDDLPYDRFILEQIAGDTVEADAALGFLVAGPANLPGQIGRDEEAMRQARQDELDEVLRTVSQSLFGLTIGCARCHDHKFDAISQEDYYSMQAIFAGLSFGNRRLRGMQNDQWTRRLPGVKKKLAALKQTLEEFGTDHNLRPALSSPMSESFDPVRADAVRMEVAATSGGSASLYEFEIHATHDSGEPIGNVALARLGARAIASSFALENQTRHPDNLIDESIDSRQAYPWVAAHSGPAWVQIDLAQPTTLSRIVWHAGRTTPVSYELKVRIAGSDVWQTVAHTRDRLPMTIDRREASEMNLTGVSEEDVGRLVKLLAEIRAQQSEVSRLAAGPQTYAASFTGSPGNTWLLRRGDPMQRVSQVEPLVPAALRLSDEVMSSASEPERRLALVRHLTRSDHPLTARVIVNRIWQHHFGAGLVRTPSDFGRMGDRPSHPELLDWLALEFIDNNWSLKWLHRQIVLTETYQQTNQPHIEAEAIDADCRLLWRFPPRRLDAETIRDSILAASGKLNLTMYGPGFDFFNQRGGLSDYTAKETFEESGWRRMIYAHKIRMESVDIFGAFDCPDAGQMTPQRSRSVTPIQALSLLNSPFVNRQAGFFAERVKSEVGADLNAAIDRIFEIALARLPTDTERSTLIELAQDHGLKQVCRVILNSSEFLYLQ